MVQYIIDGKTKKVVPTRVVPAVALKTLAHPIRLKILHELAAKSSYPLELAHRLKIHEQDLYYHLRLLEKAGLVKKAGGGRGAVKFYEAERFALSYIPDYAPVVEEISLHEFQPVPQLLRPFIKEGSIDCRIVVGAAVSHGRFRRGSRSGFLAGEIAAILGRFGRIERRTTFTDLETKNLKQNLVVLSGFKVNLVQEKLNEYLPIHFHKSGEEIISHVTHRRYSQKSDGLIVAAPNPFSPAHTVLVLAGIESEGTRAAVKAFTQSFDRVLKGNATNPKVFANVVRGVVKNGEIADVEFLE